MAKRKLKKKIFKKIIVFILIITITTSLMYIENKYNILFPKVDNPIKENNNKTEDKIEEIKNPSKNILTEDNIKNKEPLSLETPSGAVLVGIISKDSDGWYFMPEQPLNLTLTYYVEYPEQFDNVTKLRMLDDSEDNFSKALYANELVTVTGEILNPRSAGILYLYPYDIKTGKQVNISYADKNIKAPENEFGTMDESLLPSKMQSKIVNNEYKYNFYMVSKETLYNFDNDFINFYLEFVDAFLNYETSIPCPKKNYAEYVVSILDYEFPVFFADGEYNFTSIYDPNTKTMNWAYTSKNKTEHDKLIKEFENSANSLLKGVNKDQSENLKAQTIYHNLTPIITYDYEGLETGKSLESYYVYTKHSGVCHSFAIAYSQLLTQVGIESTIANGMPETSLIGHCWTTMKIDGTYYFTDPTYEISYKNGTAYAFYGMSLKERMNTNEYNESNITIGKYRSKKLKEYGDFSKNLQIVNN